MACSIKAGKYTDFRFYIGCYGYMVYASSVCVPSRIILRESYKKVGNHVGVLYPDSVVVSSKKISLCLLVMNYRLFLTI